MSEVVADAGAAELGRMGWLRAAVLGADDGIVSTASLLVGMAAAGASSRALLTAGFAGLVAGAASMAAGEYVSVSSQRDLEDALIARQREELQNHPHVELVELAATIQDHGVDATLARRVAGQLITADPVGAVARVRYGLTETNRANPLQAALASAASFAAGAIVPLGAAFADDGWRMTLVVGLAMLALVVCGALGAQAGGASRVRAALRVVVGGGLAMAISAGAGRLVGISL
ncbi:MAG TPA: VIT1/CCC1 transporter family protein [Candidatus Eisenbacteria bacterium]|nr:VIT1/CCC1 transporter family protein [Candidatus Eisenbacteria bacterium]